MRSKSVVILNFHFSFYCKSVSLKMNSCVNVWQTACLKQVLSYQTNHVKQWTFNKRKQKRDSTNSTMIRKEQLIYEDKFVFFFWQVKLASEKGGVGFQEKTRYFSRSMKNVFHLV